MTFFRQSNGPLTDAEFKQLEENIVADGEIREPIITWNNIIIDGHHRWKIHQKHPEIPYKTKPMEFADKWAAIVWMCKKQLGQRNCSDEQKTYLIGKEYEAQKQTKGNNAERGENGQYLKAQIGPSGSTENTTAKKVAAEHGVGCTSVKRAEHFAHGLDTADSISPGFKEKVLTGSVKAPKSVIAEIAKMDKPSQKKTIKAIENGEKVSIHETNRIIAQTVAQLKRKDDEPAGINVLIVGVENLCKQFKRDLKITIAQYSTQIDEETSKKIIAALSEAETAINEMKGLVER